MKKIALILCLPLLLSCKGESEKLKRAGADQDAHYFMYGDFGSLTVGGLQKMTQPYRVANVARAMEAGRSADIDINVYTRQELEKFGLVYPDRVLNLPQTARRADWNESPIGIADGFMENRNIRVSGATLSCATCHAGRVHDKYGMPTNDVWLGLPNASVNLEGYTASIMTGLDHVTKNRKVWKDFIKRYDATYDNEKERSSLVLLGATVRQTIQKFAETNGRLAPYIIGTPGMTNGMASLKTQMGVLDTHKFYEEEVGLVSIPSLADRGFRSSFLVDGIYGVNGEERFYEINSENYGDPEHLDGLAKITSVFLIPTMALKASKIKNSLDDVRKAFNFVKDIEMPPFPAEVDMSRAQRGQQVYSNSCAQCHGVYSGPLNKLKLTSFPNKLSTLEEIGTDPMRVTLAQGKSIEKLQNSAASKYVNAVPQKGYVATILTGLWATAPYLHNGSVPSLWALMNPEERPDVFKVGGHALDYTTMGISYPKGFTPTSTPYKYDTSELGQSNKGHEKEFEDLSQDEKLDLLEYLKLI